MNQKPIECVTQTESWSCGLLSWAALLRMTPNQLVRKLSCDAQKTIQLNQLADELHLDPVGLSMDLFVPVVKRMLKGISVVDLDGLVYEKVEELIRGKEGILVYALGPDFEFRHAVCWNGRMVIDPDAGERTLKSIYRHNVELFYTLFDLKKTDFKKGYLSATKCSKAER